MAALNAPTRLTRTFVASICESVLDWMSYNWLPLTASVESAEILPGATFVIVRSLPLEPTLTVLGRSAIEPAPRATEF